MYLQLNRAGLVTLKLFEAFFLVADFHVVNYFCRGQIVRDKLAVTFLWYKESS